MALHTLLLLNQHKGNTMAIGTLIELGMKAKNAYNSVKRDPEIPVPGRVRTEMPVKAAPPTSKEKAN